MGVLIASVGIAALAIAVGATVHRRNTLWGELGKQLGLRTHSRVLEGEVAGRAVELFEGRVAGRTQLLARIEGGVHPGIWLRAGSMERNNDTDVLTGDPEFDALVRAGGPEVEVLALLTTEARGILKRDIRSADAVLQRGAFAFSQTLSRSHLPRIVDSVRNLAEAMTMLGRQSGCRADQLARNALEDELPGVRLRNLRALVAYFPEEQLVFQTASTALKDLDARVQLEAAQILGGSTAWSALERLVDSELLDDGVREEALRLLEQSAPGERLVPIARQALGASSPRLQFAAILALGRARDVSSLVDICRLATVAPLAVAVATALGDLGDALAQPMLLQLLESKDLAVQIRAARSLERVGDLRAVALLLERGKGLVTDGALKDACHGAARAIQSRQAGAGTGQLSVASTDEAGALSLPEEGGELSLPPPNDNPKARSS